MAENIDDFYMGEKCPCGVKGCGRLYLCCDHLNHDYAERILDAAFNNHIGCLKHLVEIAGSIDVKNKKGYTALHIAAKKHPVDVVAILIDHGANVNAKSTSGITPLCRMDLCYNEDVPVYKYLIEKGGFIREDVDPVDDLEESLKLGMFDDMESTESIREMVKYFRENDPSLMIKEPNE